MSNNEFEFGQNPEYDGMLAWRHAKTLTRYRELRKEQTEMDVSKYRCFFAFSREQLVQGQKSIGLKEGERLVSFGCGGYGTEDGVRQMFARLEEIESRIKTECDPQEVYCYEFNNHESFLSFDGDVDAIRLVKGIFGLETALKIKRFSAFYSLESLFKTEENKSDNSERNHAADNYSTEKPV